MLGFFVCWLMIAIPTHDLNELREQYLKAAIDKDEIEKLTQMCGKLSGKEALPTINGYCSMIHFINAKHGFNPYRKLSKFNKGKVALDSLITKHNQNIELRYLRHSIQDRVPVFLNYNGDLATDERFMIKHLEAISDSSVYHVVNHYLKNLNK